MKKFYLSLIGIALAGTSVSAQITSANFHRSSVLASDKWVKIGIEESGVYEISYETLRAMGFADPEKVCLYGRGGQTLDVNFSDSEGNVLWNDDLQKVSVIHADDKLYFYGRGVEDIQFIANSLYKATLGYYSRSSRNIYSSRGYYFLSDREEPSEMENFVPSPYSYFRPVTKGVAFAYHEKDIEQNKTFSGQLFWGEWIGKPYDKRLRFPLNLPDALENAGGVMRCDIYLTNAEGIPGTISYGFEEAESHFSAPYRASGSDYYTPFSQAINPVVVSGPKGTLFAEFDCDYQFTYSNLDYWLLTYQRGIPTMRDADGNAIGQDYILVNALDRFSQGKFQVPNPSTTIAIDITSRTRPLRLPVEGVGSTGEVKFERVASHPEIIIFDTSIPQKQISMFESAYGEVANQNLHAAADTGADFVIICIPSLRDQAERLAQIHRERQGISVIVATTEECYNEFSAGVPDPMAYRAFVKMLHLSPNPPKNLLLFGPLYSDFRGIGVEKDPLDGIIAYQSPSCSTQRGAHNVNDFYGMMGDRPRTDLMERNDVHVGVAILPVKFVSEAETVIDKIDRYLARTDHAYYLNRALCIGGLYDEHTHDRQVSDIIPFISGLDNGSTVITPLSIDTYGNSEAQKKFFNAFDSGLNWLTYFGHGAETFLGKDRHFFAAGDIAKLNNEVLPLAGFAGCQITNTDRGLRGLGETIVTNTPHGCIGTIVSARETWSGQNLEFFKTFFISNFRQGTTATSTPISAPQTIGEVYARVKTTSTYNNELAYQLICDPAIVIPSIQRDITLGETPVACCGEMLSIEGRIADWEGNEDGAFNGEAVVRLMQPARQVACGSIESGEDTGDLTFTYADAQISMGVAEVKDGRFSLDINVPQSAREFVGQDLILYLAAYDPDTRIGAGSRLTMTLCENPSGTVSSESKDLLPPAIEVFAFDPSDCSINLTVSDNYALNMNNDPFSKGLTLFIDGRECLQASIVQPRMETGRPAYSKSVPLTALSYGQHSARLRVKDAAGNTNETEILFTYDPTLPDYRLDIAENPDRTCTRFEISGGSPDKATLIILDSMGNEIYASEFSGGSVVWNNIDSTGKAVAKGHYKAYVIERGTSGSNGHSQTLDVPVI